MWEKNIEVFFFKVLDIAIGGCYKAPGKSLTDIEMELINVNYLKIYNDENFKQFLIMGDFNHDLKNEKKAKTAYEFINKIRLKNCMHTHTNTTDEETQIDWCLSKYEENFSCGTYESYFSYHKPIWILSSYGQNLNIINPEISNLKKEFSQMSIDIVSNSISHSMSITASQSQNSLKSDSTEETDEIIFNLLTDILEEKKNIWISTIDTHNIYQKNLICFNKNNNFIVHKDINAILENYSLKKVNIPKDGLCFINSLRIFFINILKLNITLQDIKERLLYHMFQDLEFIQHFLPELSISSKNKKKKSNY